MNSHKDRLGVIQINKPTYETFAVAYISIGYFLHVVCFTLRHLVGDTHKLDTFFVYALVLLLLAIALNDVIKRLQVWQIAGIIVEITVLTFFMLSSSNRETHEIVLNKVITQCIPMFLCGACIVDYADAYKKLIRVMDIIPYFYLLMMLMFGLNKLSADATYSQSDGYTMLLIAVVLTSATVEHFSIKHLIPLGISMFFMLSYGARGPFVCWIMFLVIKIAIQMNQVTAKKKIGVIIGLSTIGGLLFFNYYKILMGLRVFFSQSGFSVRIIDRMLDSSLLTDKGRGSIAEMCLDRIQSNPLSGTGPVNDRIYLASRFGIKGNGLGSYPHNIFLEFLMQYGVIIGGILVILVIMVLIKAYRSQFGQLSKAFILVLIASYFFPLLFSRSYLDNDGFYFLIGVCLSAVINQRKKSLFIQGEQYCENS